MVGNDVFHLPKPERGDLGQYIALVGNAFVHDNIEGGNAVGGDDQEAVAEIVDVPHFAPGGQFQIGKIGI